MSRQVGDYHSVIAHVASRYHFLPMPPFVADLQDLASGLLRAVAEFLQRLFGLTSLKEINSIGASDFLRGLLVLFGMISFVVLIFVAVKRLAVLSAQARKASGVDIFQQLLSATEWRNQAALAATSGDFRTACRALYMSCLRRLDEQSVLPFNSTRTNYEYYLALHGRKALQNSFRGLADIFDALWFGDLSAGEEEYERSLAFLKEIEVATASTPGDQKASLNG